MLSKVRTAMSHKDAGFSLPEVLAAIAVGVIILAATAAALMQTYGIQQDNERYSRAVQIAKDYTERAKSTPFDQLGFHSSDTGLRPEHSTPVNSLPTSLKNTIRNGYKWTKPLLPTSVIHNSKQTVGFLPLEERAIGGVMYTIRTDIANVPQMLSSGTPKANSYAMKLVTVTVTYLKETGEPHTTTLTTTRTPLPSDQIPPQADFTERPGSDGQPSSPTYFNEALRQAGVTSAVLGEEITVRVNNPGLTPVKDVSYTLLCPSGSEKTILFSSPGAGVSKSSTVDTFTISYTSLPSGVPCAWSKALEITVVAMNSNGSSVPFTILPENFLDLGA